MRADYEKEHGTLWEISGKPRNEYFFLTQGSADKFFKEQGQKGRAFDIPIEGSNERYYSNGEGTAFRGNKEQIELSKNNPQLFNARYKVNEDGTLKERSDGESAKLLGMDKKEYQHYKKSCEQKEEKPSYGSSSSYKPS